MQPYVSICLLPIALSVSLRLRSENLIWKSVQVVVLSIIAFLLFLGLANPVLPSVSDPTYSGSVILIYLGALLVVFLTSVLVNYGRGSLVEIFGAFGTITAIVLASLIIFTDIALVYSIAIAFLTFLALWGGLLYRNHDENATWVARAWLVLGVFCLVGYLSRSILFVAPGLATINDTLMFTLTAGMTGLAFVGTFNKISQNLRKISFPTALSAVIIAFPTFFYYVLTSSYVPVPVEPPVALLIALNLMILLSYVSLGIYQWGFSRAIWEAGWWIWLFLPLVNFTIINQAFTGVDIATKAALFFGVSSVRGSIILTIIACSLLYLPVIYTKIKQHFYKVILFIWVETLFLAWWITSNIFSSNITLSASFFGVFSIFILMPLLYKLKAWKILSYMWIAAAALNSAFVFVYFNAQGMPIENLLSLEFIVVGFFFIAYSFFPNIRHPFLVATISYGVTMGGLFFLIYFILIPIVLNPAIAVNLSFIVFSFSLFTSKYLKLNRKVIYFAIAVILIGNLSLLTLFSFLLIPGLELFAVAVALAVGGASFSAFNKLGMIKHVDDRIPWFLLSIGVTLSISSLFLIFVHANLMAIGFVFSAILLGFMYRYLHQYRYVLWFLFPIPLTLLTQAILLSLPVPVQVIPFTTVATYVAWFQTIFFMLSKSVKNGRIIQKRYAEVLLRQDLQGSIQSVGFLLNSIFIPLSIAILSPVSWINQVLEFCMLWDFATLCSLKHLERIKSQQEPFSFLRFYNGLGLFFYFLAPITVVFNVTIAFIEVALPAWGIITISIAIFSLIFFVETYAIDRLVTQVLAKRTRDWGVLWSWLTLANTTLLFVFSISGNIFFSLLILCIINLPSVHFLFQVNREKYGRTCEVVKFFLLNSIFALISLNLASLVVLGVEGASPPLIGPPTILLFIAIFTIAWFFLNAGLNRSLLPNVKRLVNFYLFISFQVFFAASWIFIAILLSWMKFYAMWLLILCETGLCFFSLPEATRIFSWAKSTQIQGGILSALKFSANVEISLVFLGVFLESLTLLPSFLLSQCILLALTIIELPFIAPREKPLILLLHTISFFAVSISVFCFLSQFFFILGIQYCLVLLLLCGTLMYGMRAVSTTVTAFVFNQGDYLTPRAPPVASFDTRSPSWNEWNAEPLSTPELLSSADGEKKIQQSTRVQDIQAWDTRVQLFLLNIIFVLISLYLTLNITTLVQQGVLPLNLFATISLSVAIFSISYLGITIVFNRTLSSRVAQVLKICILAVFQAFLACAWVSLSMLAKGNLLVAILLLLIIETSLTVPLLNLATRFTSPQRAINMQASGIAWLLTGIHLELTGLVYCLCIAIIPPIESLLLASASLFAFTAVELLYIRQMGQNIARFIHATSYLTTSLFLFLFILQFVAISGLLLSLDLFLFICMQFYTNFATFTAVKQYWPANTEKLLRLRGIIYNILGVLFYTFLLAFFQATISSAFAPVQLFLLSLALFLFLLLDENKFKFISVRAIPLLKAIAWGLMLVFGTWLLSGALTMSIALLPPIILLNLAGLAYLASMLSTGDYIKQRITQIKRTLLIGAYATLASWPWFFSAWNPFVILGVISSFALILLGISYLDEGRGVLGAQILGSFRRVSQVLVGGALAGWVFVLMQFSSSLFVNTPTLDLTLSVTALIFLLCLALFLQPFQKKLSLSLGFWVAIFVTFGCMTYFIWRSIGVSVGIVVGATFLYPFIFLPNFRKWCILAMIHARAAIISFLRLTVKKLKAVYANLHAFWMVHFMGIWMVVSAMAGILTFAIYVYLTFQIISISSFAIGIFVFFLFLYGIFLNIPEGKKLNVKTFRNEVTYYGSLYTAFAWSIFSFFPVNLFLILAAVLLFGGVLLFFIYREEKRGKISIYWRFITTLLYIGLAFTIVLLIILHLY